MCISSYRRTVLAAASTAGITLALLGAPTGSTAASTAAGTTKAAAAPACADLSCLTPMTEQARLAQFAGVQATHMGADSATALRTRPTRRRSWTVTPTRSTTARC